MMTHGFEVEIAVKYGVNAAVLLYNIQFWIKKNKANKRNFYDGTYWTYNSRSAFSELFPYMSERQIKTALDKLIADDVIKTGCYNADGRDRSLWYALTDKGWSMMQKCQMQTAEMSNANSKNVRPLPDINTDDKPDHSARKRAKSDSPDGFEDFWKVYPRRVSKQTALKAWMKLKADETLTKKIVEDVRRRIEGEWRGRDVQYIPHPTTYLNQRRWEDEGEQSSEPVREWNDMTADEKREALDSGPFGKWY